MPTIRLSVKLLQTRLMLIILDSVKILCQRVIFAVLQTIKIGKIIFFLR